MIGLLEDDTTSGSSRALIDLPGPQNLVVTDWGASSLQGRQRLQNEDNWSQLGPIFVVADGMGGLVDGQDASAIAARSVAERWFAAGEPSPDRVVRDVNQAVRSVMDEKGVHGGCTVSALRVQNDQATVVHVGDSRVYRVRGEHAELLTRDHNLRSELLAAGIMPGSAKSLGPLRALTSYIGMQDHELQIDVRSIGLRSGDRLVLCTDGVFGEMTHSEFAQRASAGSASDAATALTAHKGSDDATALVVDIKNGDR